MSYLPAAGEFCWNELMTGDVSRAKEFYSELLGWQFKDIDMGDMTYTTFSNGDKDVAGMMATPKGENIPPHWMSYICVDDLDEKVQLAQDLGATITVPQTDIKDHGRFAVIVDPTGAHIAFWQTLKEC